jgi:UPF0755 protein
MRLAVAGIAAAGVLAAAAFSLSLPQGNFQERTFVEIPRGGSFGVAQALADAGVVRYRWQFLAVRLLRPRTRLLAGEYLFDKPASVWRVFDRLARGDMFYYQLVTPEGSTIFDIAASIEKLGVVPGQEFLRAARDASLIHDLAPEAVTLEGYLFPDTYRIKRNATAEQVCAQMTGRFRQAWARIGSPAGVNSVVTLASLVEKETAREEERPVVASVFRNRLALGMPLDCDPTAIYAALLEGRFSGEIHRSDLDSRNRYNTYQYAGLPPGPIANPGLASMQAALHPADTNYLYFVASPNGSGAHVFSKGLEAHQRAVSKYRRENNKANQARPSQPVRRRDAARSNR